MSKSWNGCGIACGREKSGGATPGIRGAAFVTAMGRRGENVTKEIEDGNMSKPDEMFGLPEMVERMCNAINSNLELVQVLIEDGDIGAALEEIENAKVFYAQTCESAQRIANACRTVQKTGKIVEDARRINEETDRLLNRAMFWNLVALGIMGASLITMILLRVLR